MRKKAEKLSSILNVILYGFSSLFILNGFIRLFQNENAIGNFILAGFFLIISGSIRRLDEKCL